MSDLSQSATQKTPLSFRSGLDLLVVSQEIFR